MNGIDESNASLTDSADSSAPVIEGYSAISVS
jgi:hypothetical protein